MKEYKNYKVVFILYYMIMNKWKLLEAFISSLIYLIVFGGWWIIIANNTNLDITSKELAQQIATFQSGQEYQLTEMNNSISVMAEVLYGKK
jgi:hypothetical protein